MYKILQKKINFNLTNELKIKALPGEKDGQEAAKPSIS